AYAVDSDGDGRRDLFASWHDIIGSVANYFVRHGWKSKQPVVSDASFTADFHGDIPKKNSLKPDSTVAVLAHSGVTFDDVAAPDAAARLIAFAGKDAPEYYVGFKNFYVITRYNRSAMCAMAVWQLGNEVATARKMANEKVASK
ncbi:MAG: lytic murein transglycosylase, partial [Pseudomonadota bacterium]